MTPPPSSAPTTLDPDVADAVARAELRRSQLERLVLIGVEMAEEIRERNVQAPRHPEPRHDPNRGFALVSRAVRLTLAFAARIDMDILAMRKGEPTSFSRPVAAPRSAAPPNKPVAAASSPVLGPEGIRVRAAVWSAIDAEHGVFDKAMVALDDLNERLIEYETQDRFTARSFRECVEAICDDLGLRPDWSAWSEETGFVGPLGKPNVKWHMIWSDDPKQAEFRRRLRAKRLESG